MKLTNSCRKYCYIIVPLLFIFLIYAFVLLDAIDLSAVEKNVGIMASVTGSLIGFLITTFAIINALSGGESRFICNFFNSQHPIIFSRIIIIGIISSMACVLFSIAALDINLIFISFLISIVETFMAAWYIYKVIKMSSKSS